MADYFTEEPAEWGLTDEDYYARPPTAWDRADVWARAASDPALIEAVRLEPDLLKVLELARRSRRTATYSWRRRRVSLKPLVELYVGDTARLDALSTSRHYDAGMDAIDALLPRDRMDDEALLIERGDDEVRAILHTRPILPTKEHPNGQTYSEVLDELREEWETGISEDKLQRESDRAWVAALQITPDPILQSLLPQQ